MTTALSGTSLSTTALAPTETFRPIVMLGYTTAPGPKKHKSPIVTLPPMWTPGQKLTQLPIRPSCPSDVNGWTIALNPTWHSGPTRLWAWQKAPFPMTQSVNKVAVGWMMLTSSNPLAIKRSDTRPRARLLPMQTMVLVMLFSRRESSSSISPKTG